MDFTDKGRFRERKRKPFYSVAHLGLKRDSANTNRDAGTASRRLVNGRLSLFHRSKKKDRLISRKSKHFYLDKVCDLCRGYYYDSSAIFHGWFPRIHCNRVNQIDTYLIIFIEFFSNFVCFCKHKITITTTQKKSLKLEVLTPRRDATFIILAKYHQDILNN